MVPDNVSLCFQGSSIRLSRLFRVCGWVCWPGRRSPLLIAINSSPLPVCSPASHQFISLLLGHSSSDRWFHFTGSLSFRPLTCLISVPVGCVLTCFFFPGLLDLYSPVCYHLLPPPAFAGGGGGLTHLSLSVLDCFIPTSSTSNPPCPTDKTCLIHTHVGLRPHANHNKFILQEEMKLISINSTKWAFSSVDAFSD